MIQQKLILSAATAMAVVALAACNPAEPAKPAVDTAKVAEAIKADLHDMLAGFNGHDVAKAVSHDAPDFVGMMHGAPNVKGPDEDALMTKTQFAAMPDAKVETADETVDVAASGDMAVYRSSYTFTGTDPRSKKPITEKGNWVAGYKKVGEGWKLAWSVISDVGAGNGMPVTAPAAAK